MTSHEVRDPIHSFVRLEDHERPVLDSRPMQRLRHIHQLALTYMVYPGATHRRFEHSLGVMETASRIFDVATDPGNVRDEIRPLLPLDDRGQMMYWRRVLRIAALVHDVGHLPFSHAAEKELLPPGWDHERITREIIRSDEMQAVLEKMRPRPSTEDVVKLAVGPRKASDLPFSDWEVILSEMITGDVFGADRIDYLLRDSHHLGVAYGRFDHHRLIDTLRILPPVPVPERDQLGFPGLEAPEPDEGSRSPALGVEEGGLESAEALLLARYLMYSQVYFHDNRRVYDHHLVSFLKAFLPNGEFGVQVDDHLATTDNEIGAGLRAAAFDSTKPGHPDARRILCHEHYKVLYHATASDIRKNVDAPRVVYEALIHEVGQDGTWIDYGVAGNRAPDFPVWNPTTRRSESAFAISKVLQQLPDVATNRVYVSREKYDSAREWFLHHHDNII